ncbi:MAG TPA: Tol-Pal system subunit TolQ [Desulfobacteraceae bacterium]|nr:Tol-Pal system subunit TolQ [Desulfobacteraceae bacterium]
MPSSGLDLIAMISNAGFMVRFVLLLLLFFSVASWAIIIIKYYYLSRAFKESILFTDFFWKNKNFSAAFTKSKTMHGSPVAKIFRVGYLELKKLSRATADAATQNTQADNHKTDPLDIKFTGINNVQRALRQAINTETTKMMQLIPFLATTGNTAPFIGLFGTVWGIMNSFHEIGAKGSASLSVVAPGISEALVATAAGLAAAIPAVIAFNHFTQKIRIIETELQNFSADLLNIIERDILR